VDGKVDAQPLYLSNVSIPGHGTKNVLYIPTEHGSVFAFDADSVSGNTTTPLWVVSTQMPGELPSDDRGCGQVTPEIGITSTPVIDRGRGAIYVVALDRDNMGKFNANQNNIYELISGQLAGGEFAKPSYFNGTVYYGAVGDALKAFPITNAKLAVTPSSQSSNQLPYPGTTPTISANGAANGIVWAVENGNTAVLYAYDATNLASELYNSNQAANSRGSPILSLQSNCCKSHEDHASSNLISAHRRPRNPRPLDDRGYRGTDE